MGSSNNNMLEQGVSFCKLGKYGEAIECFEKALATDPCNMDLLNNNGNVLLLIGRLVDARKCFEKALEIDP